MDERRSQLDNLIGRVDKAKAHVQRLQGQLDAARSELETVEAECRAKKIPPDQLDAAISKLQQRYDKALADLTEQVATTERDLAPFLGETA